MFPPAPDVPDPVGACDPPTWRSRGIPWPAIIRFHKEIAARAEQSFFSLYAKDDQAERWSSLLDYSPDELSEVVPVGWTADRVN